MTKAFILAACTHLLVAPVLMAATNVTATSASTSTSATSLINQMSTAFSAGNVVHQVQLSGTAALYAGSFHDEGAATLSATATGSSQVQLSLSSGSRSEAQSGQGTDLTCTWTGQDGLTHDIDLGNCWRPVLWFLPPLSLQPSQLPSYLGALDLGSGAVGFGASSYRHLQTELVLPNLSTSLTTNMMQRSTVDLGLDPVSLLPAVLSYTIHPDNGAPIDIAVEIHYAKYQAINGVQIPFTIRRYINGSLQLEINITSAQVN